MNSKQIVTAATTALLSAGAITGAVAADKSNANKSSNPSSASAPPLVVLVPVAIATADNFSNGCWVRFYDSTDFKGNQLSLVGPIDMPNMRTAFGKDWSGEFDSIRTGPKATVTVYDAENYRDKAQTFQPSKGVADLDEKMATFEQVRSVKIACADGNKSAQAGQSGSGSATADQKRESFAKLDTDNDGMLGRTEAAADADAKSQFDRLDANDDQKLSRSEYEAWESASATTR